MPPLFGMIVIILSTHSIYNTFLNQSNSDYNPKYLTGLASILSGSLIFLQTVNKPNLLLSLIQFPI